MQLKDAVQAMLLSLLPAEPELVHVAWRCHQVAASGLWKKASQGPPAFELGVALHEVGAAELVASLRSRCLLSLFFLVCFKVI